MRDWQRALYAALARRVLRFRQRASESNEKRHEVACPAVLVRCDGSAAAARAKASKLASPGGGARTASGTHAHWQRANEYSYPRGARIGRLRREQKHNLWGASRWYGMGFKAQSGRASVADPRQISQPNECSRAGGLLDMNAHLPLSSISHVGLGCEFPPTVFMSSPHDARSKRA